jgi:hypothetical protein
MGLTIHYRLQSDRRGPAEARRLVEQLRQRALDLPFQAVGEIVEVSGDSADIDKVERNDPNAWLLIQAGQSIERDGRLKDAFGDGLESEIVKFSNFEHLEARAEKKTP